MPKELKNRSNRKHRSLKAWSVLNMLGLLQNQVAYRIGVHPAYFSKVINEQEEAALSEEKLQKLETYVREKIIAIVKEILGLGLASVYVISTRYAASELFTSKQEDLIKNNVFESVASIIAGCSEPPTLPNGVYATTVRIDGGSHCEVYVIVTKCNGKNITKARIHEYEHLSSHFKDKANDLRGSGAPPILPEKLY